MGISTHSAEQLARIVDDTQESPRTRAQARAELVKRFPCRDCGAEAGRECKPEYGCRNTDRA